MVANTLLKQYFGYDHFREGQNSLIQQILARNDVLGIMPTGAGKSICFQVPALALEGITLVISPLISLMQDQVKSLNQAGVHAAYINSSLTHTQVDKALYYASQGQYKIIYVAPERLLTDTFLAFAQSVHISMVTIDEAHCISQWGQDFRPSYAMIPQFLSLLNNRPIVSAFTATATAQVREDIIQLLALQNPFTIITGFNRENLYFEVKPSSHKMNDLLAFLENRKEQSGIIYCATRKNVESVCDELNKIGFSAAKYHAGLSQETRQNNQNDFQYDTVNIMVATNAFGMGIDKSNVNFVVHYNMPKDVESYYQEAGRAGRDGAPAHCLLLYSGQDVVTQQWIIENGRDMVYENEEMEQVLKERDYKRLKEMTFYSTTNQCLRQYILAYFGEHSEMYCGNCGNCDTKFETIDITEDAKNIVLCIQQLRERFGKVLIIDVLRGSKGTRILQLGLDQLPIYGSSPTSQSRLRSILDYLIQLGYLEQTDERYPIIKLTERAEQLFSDTFSLEMKIAKEKETSKKKETTKQGLSSEHHELFTRLRALRSEIATNEQVPAFIVFGDATLIDMCQKLPVTLTQFSNVSGVGSRKLKKYGDPFITMISSYCDEKGIAIVSESKNETDKKRNSQGSKKKKSAAPIVLPTDNMIAEIVPSESPLSISEISRTINQVLSQYECTRTSPVKLSDWLIEQGYLQLISSENGNLKVPTELGFAKGIQQELRTIRGKQYQINLYNQQLQEFLIQHIEEILKFLII
ncbi:MAG: DNA helicase RecQ [Eubacteriales bacterium]